MLALDVSTAATHFAVRDGLIREIRKEKKPPPVAEKPDVAGSAQSKGTKRGKRGKARAGAPRAPRGAFG